MARKSRRSQDICRICRRPKQAIRHDGLVFHNGKLMYGSKICRGLFSNLK